MPPTHLPRPRSPAKAPEQAALHRRRKPSRPPDRFSPMQASRSNLLPQEKPHRKNGVAPDAKRLVDNSTVRPGTGSRQTRGITRSPPRTNGCRCSTRRDNGSAVSKTARPPNSPWLGSGSPANWLPSRLSDGQSGQGGRQGLFGIHPVLRTGGCRRLDQQGAS